MSGTLNSQAIKVANNIMQAAQEVIDVWQKVVAIDAVWTDIGAATALAAMQTMPVNPDGTPTGTPDGTPNSAHPIDSSKYPQLAQALSSTQITQAKTILDAFRSLVEGNAVAAQSGARAILNAAING